MQKIFTLALSIVISSSIFAAAEFYVKINSSGNYTVSLNNQTITNTGNVFRFFDLSSGNYNLKVYENGFNGRMLYDQLVTITDGYRTVAELDRFSGLKIIDKIPFVQSSWYIDNLIPSQGYPYSTGGPKPKPKPGHGPHGNNGYGNNYPYNNYPSYPNNYPGYPNNYPGYPNNYPYGGNYGYGYGNLISDVDFQTLLKTVENISFDDKKIELIKTALKQRNVQTSQVHQLMEKFSFEQNKLEVAKYCYDKTIDKNNYYTLYDDFTFSNYSTQLDKYINSK